MRELQESFAQKKKVASQPEQDYKIRLYLDFVSLLSPWKNEQPYLCSGSELVCVEWRSCPVQPAAIAADEMRSLVQHLCSLLPFSLLEACTERHKGFFVAVVHTHNRQLQKCCCLAGLIRVLQFHLPTNCVVGTVYPTGVRAINHNYENDNLAPTAF